MADSSGLPRMFQYFCNKLRAEIPVLKLERNMQKAKYHTKSGKFPHFL
jgi:hypothetical protein